MDRYLSVAQVSDSFKRDDCHSIWVGWKQNLIKPANSSFKLLEVFIVVSESCYEPMDVLSKGTPELTSYLKSALSSPCLKFKQNDWNIWKVSGCRVRPSAVLELCLNTHIVDQRQRFCALTSINLIVPKLFSKTPQNIVFSRKQGQQIRVGRFFLPVNTAIIVFQFSATATLTAVYWQDNSYVKIQVRLDRNTAFFLCSM